MPRKKKNKPNTGIDTRLEGRIHNNTIGINDVRMRFKQKTSFKEAATQGGLAVVAIACITAGIKMAEGNLFSGSALIILGAILFVLNFYFGGQ